MTIHVVVGPPCSGKSTFVATHAAPGVPRFDFDQLGEIVGAQPLPTEFSSAVVDTVLAMRRGVMGFVLDPETRIDEMWIVNPQPAQSTIEKFQAVGAEFHVIDPGEDECIARAIREGYPPETIERIKQWYKSPPEIPDHKGGEVLKLKDFHVSVKSDESIDEGEFVAYASVFGNEDSYGDVVEHGAFAKTLLDWKESGNVIPVLYGHDFHDPFSNIGFVKEAVEDEHGLKVHAKLDLDNPKAAQVYKLMKQRRLNQMSFAFDVVNGAFETENEREVYKIREAKLYEVSVVPIGANQETEVLAIKANQPCQCAKTSLDAVQEDSDTVTEDEQESHNDVCSAKSLDMRLKLLLIGR